MENKNVTATCDLMPSSLSGSCLSCSNAHQLKYIPLASSELVEPFFFLPIYICTYSLSFENWDFLLIHRVHFLGITKLFHPEPPLVPSCWISFLMCLLLQYQPLMWTTYWRRNSRFDVAGTKTVTRFFDKQWIECISPVEWKKLRRQAERMTWSSQTSGKSFEFHVFSSS